MWIHLPSILCPSVLEPPDSILASAWRSEMLAQSATLSTKPMPVKSWLRAWRTKPWMERLFGRILRPSTADRGVASWLASLREIHAKDSVSPESALPKMILEPFGRKCAELWKMYDPHGYSVKTYHQQSLWSITSEESGRIWKDLATRLRQFSSALRMWAPCTHENAFSFWLPTPLASDSKGSHSLNSAKRKSNTGRMMNLRDWFGEKYNLLYPPVRVVKYLMGWPIGWTDCKRAVMEWSRYRQRMHGALYTLFYSWK